MSPTDYVMNTNRVLLHNHKKYNLLLLVVDIPKKGIISRVDIREVWEKISLEIELWCEEKNLELTKVRQLLNPQYTLLGDTDFIFSPWKIILFVN